MTDLVVTAAHNYTAVGHGAVMTATSVLAGLSRLFINDDYLDKEGNPVTMAMVQGVDDGRDAARRIAKAARMSLESLLESYFHGQKTDSSIHLFLGVPSTKRPGPPFGDICLHDLVKTLEKVKPCRSTHVYPRGNASFMYALKHAGDLITKTPDAVCIIGCIDSLLSPSTLDWFEKDERLKSETHGRHQGLIPGEAAGFLIVEGVEHALKNKRRIHARITGAGIATEPSPRAKSFSTVASGLTIACRSALNGTAIKTVFGDLNGENSRAREWGLAETRCFSGNSRKLWRPSDYYGDIGAASGIILTSIAAIGFDHKKIHAPALIFCSDDHGACGALTLRRDDLDDDAFDLYGYEYKEENHG